jgi:hypothetical protein
MTSLQDCLEDVIGKGSGYVIRTSLPTGAYNTMQWQPAAFLAHLQLTSPGVLADHAWTEWHTHRTSGPVGYVHYGALGSSLAHLEVPGYGRLTVLEHSDLSLLSPERVSEALFGTSSNTDGY